MSIATFKEESRDKRISLFFFLSQNSNRRNLEKTPLSLATATDRPLGVGF